MSAGKPHHSGCGQLTRTEIKSSLEFGPIAGPTGSKRTGVDGATDTKFAPWYIVRSDDKRRARLKCIRHLLDLIAYEKVPREKVKLPERSMKGAYDDLATLDGMRFVSEA
jgi:Polyphosphate kinase 2 (PPK2)